MAERPNKVRLPADDLANETNVKTKRSRKSRANSLKVEASSDNVFADLGFHNAEERLLKAKLATKIAQLIENKGWTPAHTENLIRRLDPYN